MTTLDIGVIVGLGDNPREGFDKVQSLGLAHCQLNNWKPELFDDTRAEAVVAASRATGVSVSSVWAGYSGPQAWNFVEGPATIGLVPPEHRAQRVEDLKRGADFAAKIGVDSITTHVGFLPIDPNDPDYIGTVEALKEIADYCGERSIEFRFETGQETPVVLLRTIEHMGRKNVGINLDPANLVLYGMANPVDALDVFGSWVRELHAKDGLYPTGGEKLGEETPLGEGKVDFPRLVGRLKELGFDGVLTIEREISGARQLEDIHKAIELLRPLC